MKKYLFLFLLIGLLTACATTNKVLSQLQSTVVQDNTFYIDQKDMRYVAVQQKQTVLAKDYLSHWFSPWMDQFPIDHIDKIKQTEVKVQKEFLLNPGLNENNHAYSQAWAENIIENANFKAFPNLNMKAITIRNVNMRDLPTNEPSFNSLTKAGQWYPFDTIQGSFLAANMPIRILHVSRDGLWYFIVTPNCFGWLPSNSIAFVDHKFIKKWQTNSYLMVDKDNVPVFNNKFQLLLKTRMGILYPFDHTTKYYQKVLVAVLGPDQNAIIKIANLRKKYGHHFPIKINPNNIAMMANRMLGSPYGWGGMYEYRDCSATQMDLFAPFGIWLPRNSSKQAEKGGPFISLLGLSNDKKEEFILKNAIPFLTLIHVPGHIMLYIGSYHKQVYIFHNIWGLRTKNLLGQEGRAVVGSTVITPLRFGDNYLNVFKHFLNRVDKITFLGMK